jgi:hypothetical protein
MSPTPQFDLRGFAALPLHSRSRFASAGPAEPDWKCPNCAAKGETTMVYATKDVCFKCEYSRAGPIAAGKYRDGVA